MDYVHTCIVEKDLVKAAQIQYQWSLDQRNGIDELDGSYCFIEGHCSNTAVTNSTTLEESYQMCDYRYGRRSWTKIGSLMSLVSVLKPLHESMGSPYDGFHNTEVTKVFLKAACAMGNYHCDVMYCKETYCKMKHYKDKYEHLQPDAPGQLLYQRDWLNGVCTPPGSRFSSRHLGPP